MFVAVPTVAALGSDAVPYGPELTLGELDLASPVAIGLNGDDGFLAVTHSAFSGLSVRAFDGYGQPLLSWQDLRFGGATAAPAAVGAVPGAYWLAVEDAWSGPIIDLVGWRAAFDGSLIGEPFSLPEDPNGDKTLPRLVTLPDEVLLTWTTTASFADDSGTGIQLRRFHHDGTPASFESAVNDWTAGDQSHSDIGAATDGSHVVAWASETSRGSDQDGWSIQAARLPPGSVAAGAQFQVNAHADGDQTHPRVAVAPDGSFVVAWESTSSPGSDATGLSVIARWFGADGSPLTGDVQLNVTTEGDQATPLIAWAPPDSLRAIWFSDEGETSSIRWRNLVALGQAESEERIVARSGPEAAVRLPLLSANFRGNFLVAWLRAEHRGTEMRGQLFRHVLFTDGFESGDTAAWDETIP